MGSANSSSLGSSLASKAERFGEENNMTGKLENRLKEPLMSNEGMDALDWMLAIDFDVVQLASTRNPKFNKFIPDVIYNPRPKGR